MKAKNVIVAFKNNTLSENVSRILKSGGIPVSAVCTTGAEIRKQCLYLGDGIIISGYTFKDEVITTLADDIPDEFSIVLIGNLEQISLCDNERIFKLAVPLKRKDLICSVMMLMNIDEKSTASGTKIKSEETVKVINEAKRLLIDNYNMTEEQAHRYIQKKSMNTGQKMVDVARRIIYIL